MARTQLGNKSADDFRCIITLFGNNRAIGNNLWFAWLALRQIQIWSGTTMLAMLMVACAVAASLALGVLVAYSLSMGMFRVFRMQSLAAARRREAMRPAEVRA